MNFYRPLLLSLTMFTAACGSGGSDSGGSPSPSPSSTPTPSPTPSPTEHLSAGSATVEVLTSNALSEHSANMVDTDSVIKFNLGNDFFENPWISGSASTSSRDGLGGLFNNNACQDCHIRDGRGHAPNVSSTEDGTNFSSVLIRAAKTDITDEQALAMAHSTMANVGDSSVGGQLQQDAIPGVTKEADLRVTYSTVEMSFADGSKAQLRKPEWHLVSNYEGEGYDFDVDTVFSVRVAPSMSGLGLLALIPELEILANEDPNDANNDGISGVANQVWSIESGFVELGRFGWKAGQPSLIEQSAGAFLNDMGLTSRLHQDEPCLEHQLDCIAAPTGNGDAANSYDYEVSDKVLEAIAFYSAHLAVPERRDAYSDDVQAGKTLFNQAGCGGCHVASFVTESSAEFPELSNQTIYPYTDMLLHDMGEDLADFRLNNTPADSDDKYEYLAGTHEWRTSPLWGIGLAQTVDPEATFLHDGRAQTIMEAVLWHGGEAEASKQAVLSMSAQERSRLLAFLNDL